MKAAIYIAQLLFQENSYCCRWKSPCVAVTTLGAAQNPADIPIGLKLALVDVVAGYALAKFHCWIEAAR